MARGSVVDEQALVRALLERRIAGAGLDVYEHEPAVPAELLQLDNVVLLPHVASATQETRQAMAELTLANLAWDLNQYSKGRFTVGLGSQIKPHITRRFSMPWSKPAARMREFIQAMQAIWRCWETGEKLKQQGRISAAAGELFETYHEARYNIRAEITSEDVEKVKKIYRNPRV